MSDKTIDQLTKAFDEYDKKKEEVRAASENKKNEHEIYLDKFKMVCDEIIRPTMEDLGKLIKNRGHSFKILTSAELKDYDGRTSPASITMEIHPDSHQPDYINKNFPQLTFFAGTYNNKTISHVSTMMPKKGGMAGKRHEYNIEEITRDAVKNEIIYIVTTCFGK